MGCGRNGEGGDEKLKLFGFLVGLWTFSDTFFHLCGIVFGT